ncbi:MAG: hypothetical protein ACK5RL_17120 [Acidimicrobiales bacterium]
MTESRYRANVTIVTGLALLLSLAGAAFGAAPVLGSEPAPPGGSFATVPGPGPEPESVRDADLHLEARSIPTDEPDIVPTPIRPGGTLTGGGRRSGGGFNACFVDFNDPVPVSALPDHAIDTFAYWPFWNQECLIDGTAVSVQPIGAYEGIHFHLNYADPTLRLCPDLETIGRPEDPADLLSPCDPIDPLTEPRSGVQPHQVDLGIRIFAYDIATRDRVPFDLNQIRVLGGEAEVCFVRTDLPWIAAEPTDDPAGYCGDLPPGNWDVSDDATDAYEVRVWSRSPAMSFTDVGIGL